jgi:hypothetical protein
MLSFLHAITKSTGCFDFRSYVYLSKNCDRKRFDLQNTVNEIFPPRCVISIVNERCSQRPPHRDACNDGESIFSLGVVNIRDGTRKE